MASSSATFIPLRSTSSNDDAEPPAVGLCTLPNDGLAAARDSAGSPGQVEHNSRSPEESDAGSPSGGDDDAKRSEVSSSNENDGGSCDNSPDGDDPASASRPAAVAVDVRSDAQPRGRAGNLPTTKTQFLGTPAGSLWKTLSGGPLGSIGTMLNELVFSLEPAYVYLLFVVVLGFLVLLGASGHLLNRYSGSVVSVVEDLVGNVDDTDVDLWVPVAATGLASVIFFASLLWIDPNMFSVAHEHTRLALGFDAWTSAFDSGDRGIAFDGSPASHGIVGELSPRTSIITFVLRLLYISLWLVAVFVPVQDDHSEFVLAVKKILGLLLVVEATLGGLVAAENPMTHFLAPARNQSSGHVYRGLLPLGVQPHRACAVRCCGRCLPERLWCDSGFKIVCGEILFCCNGQGCCCCRHCCALSLSGDAAPQDQQRSTVVWLLWMLYVAPLSLPLCLCALPVHLFLLVLDVPRWLFGACNSGREGPLARPSSTYEYMGFPWKYMKERYRGRGCLSWCSWCGFRLCTPASDVDVWDAACSNCDSFHDRRDASKSFGLSRARVHVRACCFSKAVERRASPPTTTSCCTCNWTWERPTLPQLQVRLQWYEESKGPAEAYVDPCCCWPDCVEPKKSQGDAKESPGCGWRSGCCGVKCCWGLWPTLFFFPLPLVAFACSLLRLAMLALSAFFLASPAALAAGPSLLFAGSFAAVFTGALWTASFVSTVWFGTGPAATAIGYQSSPEGQTVLLCALLFGWILALVVGRQRRTWPQRVEFIRVPCRSDSGAASCEAGGVPLKMVISDFGSFRRWDVVMLWETGVAILALANPFVYAALRCGRCTDQCADSCCGRRSADEHIPPHSPVPQSDAREGSSVDSDGQPAPASDPIGDVSPEDEVELAAIAASVLRLCEWQEWDLLVRLLQSTLRHTSETCQRVFDFNSNSFDQMSDPQRCLMAAAAAIPFVDRLDSVSFADFYNADAAKATLYPTDDPKGTTRSDDLSRHAYDDALNRGGAEVKFADLWSDEIVHAVVDGIIHAKDRRWKKERTFIRFFFFSEETVRAIDRDLSSRPGLADDDRLAVQKRIWWAIWEHYGTLFEPWWNRKEGTLEDVPEPVADSEFGFFCDDDDDAIFGAVELQEAENSAISNDLPPLAEESEDSRALVSGGD